MVLPIRPNINDAAIIPMFAVLAISHNSPRSVFRYIAQIINKPSINESSVFKRFFPNSDFIPSN